MADVQANKRLRSEDASSVDVGKQTTVSPGKSIGLPSFQTSPEFIKILTQTRAEQLRPPNGIVFVAQRTDLIVDVWKGLIRHNFLSVPVLQKKGNKYYGFIDLADIMLYINEHFGNLKLETSENYWKLWEEDDIFKKKTVNDLMVHPISRRNPFHSLQKGFSLFSAIELLAREKGLHRIPIIDENRKIFGLITQSAIIDFLSKNFHLIGTKKDKPIGSFPGALRNVFSVSETDAAVNAFKMMEERGVTGLAVVNGDGKLTGNISVRDLKVIRADAGMFTRLHQNVKNFLHKLKTDYSNVGRPDRIVSLIQSDTLESAIRMLAEHHVHRIYIVDENRKPIGVMSLKDILLSVITDV